MFRKLAQKILILLYDKPLSPSDENERKLVDELKASFRDLPLPSLEADKKSEQEWLRYMKRLKELVETGDPREFLRWDVIRGTMFVEHTRYLPRELDYLKKRFDWDERWLHAINESSAGHPLPYAFHLKSSGNLIHQAYHLAVFEEKMDKDIGDMELVVEFGGGYGSMCRLFHNLGYRGKYIIYDLQPFSLLQKFYLKNLGIPILTVDNFKSSDTGVLLTSELDTLEALLEGCDSIHKAMFVATWSISETPISLRERFFPLVNSFNAYLIAYQDRFNEVDNIAYFNVWKKEQSDVNWVNYKISQIPGSNYLFGVRRTE